MNGSSCEGDLGSLAQLKISRSSDSQAGASPSQITASPQLRASPVAKTPPKTDKEEADELRALFSSRTGKPVPVGVISLPPGLYERSTATFRSCLHLTSTGIFRLKWSNSETSHWLKGSGHAIEILERVEGRVLHYEMKLRGNFVCTTAPGADGAAAVAPAGFVMGADTNRAKTSPAKTASGKKKKSPKKKAGSPSVAAAGVTADTDAGTEADVESSKVAIIEVRDGTYVMRESINCPEAAGETQESFHSWIAKIAEEEATSDYGVESIAEMSTPEWPLISDRDVELDAVAEEPSEVP